MATVIPDAKKKDILNGLAKANKSFQSLYPGDRPDRQPVHTVYGGAQLFKSETISKIRRTAESHFWAYAPNATTLARALKLTGKVEYCERIYQKILEKLESEAVEDFRIDFEDGFGNRPDEEEDETAVFTAKELAVGMRNRIISPFIGIRIKPFSEDMKVRSIRTLDIFITTLAEATGGKLPDNFVVTLPKVTIPKQVTALADLFDLLEANTELEKGSLKLEIMIETTQSIIDADGSNVLRKLVAAGKGRCVAAHFGTYDYTASCNITAKYQAMDHPVCDFAHHMMKVALAGTGIWISDGATNVMPVGPHKGDSLSNTQKEENQQVVHEAWLLAFGHIRHSLLHGFYQGWDLHPGQLAIRYAAVYTFFLESYDEAVIRLKNFIKQAGQATLVGDVFDDAATGQGLLNFFLSAMNCGAITEEEVMATGLTPEEIYTRSFLKILEGRKQ